MLGVIYLPRKRGGGVDAVTLRRVYLDIPPKSGGDGEHGVIQFRSFWLENLPKSPGKDVGVV